MKLIINVSKIIALLALCYLMFSCEDTNLLITKEDPVIEEEKDPDTEMNVSIDTLSITNNFMFNVPIVADTVFIDKQYNIDIRIELEGYSIDSVLTIYKDTIFIKHDTKIISSRYFCFYENPERVEFLIRSVDLESKDTVYFKSQPILFKAVENLSNRYVFPSVDDGKLKLTWQEFDKNNTQKYMVERWMIDDNFGQDYYGKKKYYQTFEVENAVFFDNYYVGEEAEYKITVINNEGNKQDIWYYKKSKEHPNFYVTQNSAGGYNLHFSKCKYFNNFGQYYLTSEWNFNPEHIYSTTQINDTTYHVSNVKFGDDARFWLRYLPKQLPDGFLEDDWYIYGKFLYAKYGVSSFSYYNNIVVLDNENVAYTWNEKIFKYNTRSNQVIDSIVGQSANYGFLRTTPSGKYIYAVDERKYGSPLYFWSTTSFSTNPIYTFQINFIVPPVSNNLRTIMPIPSNYSSSSLAIYDVTNGNMIYTTNYTGSSRYPSISPNGDYFFIHDVSYLKLCRYINNSFEVVWAESDWRKFYPFYNFNRLNNDLCYVWDDSKVFSVRKTSDFSVISSFSLELEAIVDIDYYSNKIMGYVTDKVLICDLNNGNLIKEIPANLSELFFYSNKTILLGNTVYSNGIKYELNQ